MPGQSPRLRQHPGCRRAPAVAVTAEHGFRIAGTGFDEVWGKPLRFDLVRGRLSALLPWGGEPPPLAGAAAWVNGERSAAAPSFR